MRSVWEMAKELVLVLGGERVWLLVVWWYEGDVGTCFGI
jgi:hypothetical protein